MSDPLGLIKTIVRREMSNVTGETNINSKIMSFTYPIQPQDMASYKPESDYVTDDSTDQWFRMEISTWGQSGRLVSK